MLTRGYNTIIELRELEYIAPDLPNSPVQLSIGKSGRLYIRVVGWSVGWLFVRHGCNSSDVTLALEDAEVVRRSVGWY